jgi:glutamate dehydrogenase (NADP+)
MTKRFECTDFLEQLTERAPGEPEFHQAVGEVFQDVHDIINDTASYRRENVPDRLTEPDRTISFRITWEDDDGEIQVNKGYRVQFNSAIGPYKGGLRFHPAVSLSVLKFLAFEQTFKNALTGLPMGGAKGGSDFDPSGRSPREIMRFCNAFMSELHHHIGPDIDVPAGDINVGQREIGYLFGAYKRITNEFEAPLTGKQVSYGGSHLRAEATGYGLVHFACKVLAAHDRSIEGKTIAISGAGNVATHAAEKALELGAKVLTLSDSRGTLHKRNGFSCEDIAWIREKKQSDATRLESYCEKGDASWHDGKTPWAVTSDIALPCATQNEVDADAARTMVDNGCSLIAEGANMPLTADARDAVQQSDCLYAPAKAANAGGVAVSGLEIIQNQSRQPWDKEKVNQELERIMGEIHQTCCEESDTGSGKTNYARGANRAAFRRVADAMIAQGVG